MRPKKTKKGLKMTPETISTKLSAALEYYAEDLNATDPTVANYM
jgi:hypothetical protein